MTGTGVGHPIISTKVLLRGGGLRANPVTRHTVGIICLVYDTSGAAWTENISAGLFTSALVLHFQFRLLFTSGLEKRTFIAVGFPVQSADWALPGNVGTIRGADAAGFVLLVHPAFLPGATVYILASFFAGDAVGGSSVENHPLEERIVVHILLGPRSAQAAGTAALLLAQLRLVQHLAAAVLGLAEPAVPGLGAAVFHELAEEQQQEAEPAGRVPGPGHGEGQAPGEERARGAPARAERGAGGWALGRWGAQRRGERRRRSDPGAAPRSPPAARAIQWTSGAGRSRALNRDGGLGSLRWAVSQGVGPWEGGGGGGEPSAAVCAAPGGWGAFKSSV